MSNEERMRILEMVAKGTISTQEANDLLNTLDSKDGVGKVQRKARFLKIRVSEDGEEKVNVNLPLSLAKVAIKFLPDDAKKDIEAKGIDIEELLSTVSDGLEHGQLVSVNDDKDKVDIYVE